MIAKTTRYSELDWLRVILILTVFLHHVFMPFNGDGWHVMNSESSKVLDHVMVYFEQLRLQTLFFIAGAASFIVLQRSSGKAFLVSKFHRLFVPLIIGMMFIVPPQTYFEHIGDYDSLASAYKKLFFAFEANHLWFIEFLIVFMVFAVPFNRFFLATEAGRCIISSLERLALKKHGLFSIGLALVFVRCSFKYFWPTESHGIENLSVSLFFLFFFIAGMLFIQRTALWQSLADNRRTNLGWLLATSALFYGYYFAPDLGDYLSLKIRWQIWWFVCSLVSWTGLLTMVGYASTYCKKTPVWLHQANELIYPFYILHQTAIVVLAFYIVQWHAGIPVKSVSLLISSFLVCAAICYYLIQPFGITRYLFGLKPKRLAKE